MKRRAFSHSAPALAAALALASGAACKRFESPERDTPAQKAPSGAAPSSVAATNISNDQPPPAASAPAASAPAASVPAASASAETLCSERDLGPDGRGNRVVDREIYSFPKLNQQLAKYPDLARAVGLDQVRTCADARLFGKRYHQYSAAHPDFDKADQPSKADSILR